MARPRRTLTGFPLREYTCTIGNDAWSCQTPRRNEGITTVLLPARNRKDLEDVPEAARQQVRFVWLERVDDAVAAALNPPGAREDAESSVSEGASPARRAARSI